MSNVKLEISEFLSLVSSSGIEAVTSDKVEQLEMLVDYCNKELRRDDSGSDFINDAVYDELRTILKSVCPESKYLGLWTDTFDNEDEADDTAINDDNTELLIKYPMISINTIKEISKSELMEFINALPYDDDEEFELHYSLKENGHGVCIGGSYGNINYSYPRGRSAKTRRDITRQAHVIVGKYIDGLSSFDRFEIRGEYVLPFANLKRAREFVPKIKTAFTGVSSMLRDSASDDEVGLLEFVAYRFICDGFNFKSKEDEYNFLEELGFTTPFSVVQGGVTKENLFDSFNSILTDFEEDIENYEYYTDGVVAQVNDYEIFSSMGLCSKGSYNLGNIALKVGYWKQDTYSGYVRDVIWTKGKSSFSPVALVTDGTQDDNGNFLGVITANGNRVSRVPLYEPANILQLEAYKGNVLFFKYGGESGVKPCYPNGAPLIKSYLANYLSDDESEDDLQYMYMEASDDME